MFGDGADPSGEKSGKLREEKLANSMSQLYMSLLML
jgi:hypothetical protein